MPEWSKGADCKSAGSAYGGSNPPAPSPPSPPNGERGLPRRSLVLLGRSRASRHRLPPAADSVPSAEIRIDLAGVAQWLEFQPSKLVVEGSNPFARCKLLYLKWLRPGLDAQQPAGAAANHTDSAGPRGVPGLASQKTEVRKMLEACELTEISRFLLPSTGKSGALFPSRPPAQASGLPSPRPAAACALAHRPEPGACGPRHSRPQWSLPSCRPGGSRGIIRDVAPCCRGSAREAQVGPHAGLHRPCGCSPASQA